MWCTPTDKQRPRENFPTRIVACKHLILCYSSSGYYCLGGGTHRTIFPHILYCLLFRYRKTIDTHTSGCYDGICSARYPYLYRIEAESDELGVDGVEDKPGDHKECQPPKRRAHLLFCPLYLAENLGHHIGDSSKDQAHHCHHSADGKDEFEHPVEKSGKVFAILWQTGDGLKRHVGTHPAVAKRGNVAGAYSRHSSRS